MRSAPAGARCSSRSRGRATCATARCAAGTSPSSTHRMPAPPGPACRTRGGRATGDRGVPAGVRPGTVGRVLPLARGWLLRARAAQGLAGRDGRPDRDRRGGRRAGVRAGRGRRRAWPQTRPTAALRLLPGFDQWVLGPGTDATSVIAAARRSAVSRTAGWIAPVVLRGGRVAGTWTLDGDGSRSTGSRRPVPHRHRASWPGSWSVGRPSPIARWTSRSASRPRAERLAAVR